jgi:hypothetical protein
MLLQRILLLNMIPVHENALTNEKNSIASPFVIRKTSCTADVRKPRFTYKAMDGIMDS